ncbi:MAG: hypothetical protein HY717_21225 [Planctomycetes bacterium]|nr:hypothetical protein [Planctomycetota bacterium]
MESFTHDLQRYTNRHDLIVARSRALHRAVAKKIRSNPDLMMIVCDNLNRWLDQDRSMGVVSRGLLEWKEILESHKVEEILDLICEESETADRLRHATPFCGVLTEDERNSIFREYASSPT